MLDNCTITELYLHLSPGCLSLIFHPNGHTSLNLCPSHSNTAGWRRSFHSQGSRRASALFWQLSWGRRMEQDSCLLCLTRDPPQSPISPVLPNSPEPNLGSILIPSRIRSRLGLTPRAMGSKEGANGLKGDTSQDTPALFQPSGYLSRDSGICSSAGT